MTTKLKIATGFFVMILIAMTVAFIGGRGISSATKDFAEYSRLAKFSTVASDIMAELYALSANTTKFLSTRSPQFMNKAEENIAQYAKLLETASSLSELPVNRQFVERQRAELNKVNNLPANLRGTLLAANDSFINGFLVSANELTSNLKSLRSSGLANSDEKVLGTLVEVWEEFAIMRGQAGVYSESRTVEDGQLVKKSLLRMHSLFDKLGNLLQGSVEKDAFAAAKGTLLRLEAAMQSMEQSFSSVASSIQAMTTFLSTASEQLGKFSAQREVAAVEGAKRFEMSNASSQRLMFGVSIAGILVGAGFTLYIVVGLVRVLNNVAVFANAVAKGNFTNTITVREKGEIGEMVQALRHIPDVLQKLIAETTTMTDKVMAGAFKHRSNAEAFPGVYGDLCRTVDALANSYTTVLDGLANPIITCSIDHKLLYLNHKAKELLGRDAVGDLCSACFQADSCGTSGCFGKNAVTTNADYCGETLARPSGSEQKEIFVTAMPLRNSKGETVGFLESVTDLTAVKSKERTMLAVANDAAEVANRVTSATEKLSAQVAHISEGAELQRIRAESTATAMAEMNATVIEVARNAGDAAKQSDQTQQKAVNGEVLVEKAVSSIDSVNKIVVALQKDMEKLGTTAASIDGVILVISDIADQTNLLALNAAIEAARAGDAGRGFAVVADEVRKLAEKTMQATQEVSGSIRAIQQSAQVSIDGVYEVVQTIQGATEYTNASGDALREIVAIASASSLVVASIATAAEQQSATSEEINRAIEEISQVVRETTKGMEESNHAVQELMLTAHELDVVMKRLT